MMVCSASLRKIIMLGFILGFGSVLIIRTVQRYRFGDECFLSIENEINAAELGLQNYIHEAERIGTQDVMPYNFTNMLKLIDLAQYAKGDMKEGFGFVARRKKITHREVVVLLNELVRERTLLREYIWNLKGHLRMSIPPRRYRSLMYYLEVLDEMVAEIRALSPKKIVNNKFPVFSI
jgi:hypothetical protein